jgi:cytochrome c oxidase subunit 4
VEADKKRAAYRQGVYVFIFLAVLTIAEFFVSAATDGSVTFLMIIALLKAGIIANFFMHIYRLWRTEEDH